MCVVVIQHDKIANALGKEKLLKRWKAVLSQIQNVVGPNEAKNESSENL